jgi:hypothetical protein
MYRYQDAIDDFRARRMFTPAGSSMPPSAADFQKSKLENCFLLPVADLQSQRLETMSKSLFRAFDPGELVVKFEGSGIFGRTLLLQTRLLIMLQVIQYRIYFIAFLLTLCSAVMSLRARLREELVMTPHDFISALTSHVAQDLGHLLLHLIAAASCFCSCRGAMSHLPATRCLSRA